MPCKSMDLTKSQRQSQSYLLLNELSGIISISKKIIFQNYTLILVKCYIFYSLASKKKTIKKLACKVPCYNNILSKVSGAFYRGYLAMLLNCINCLCVLQLHMSKNVSYIYLAGVVLMYYHPFFPYTASLTTLAKFKFVFVHFCAHINFSDDIIQILLRKLRNFEEVSF